MACPAHPPQTQTHRWASLASTPAADTSGRHQRPTSASAAARSAELKYRRRTADTKSHDRIPLVKLVRGSITEMAAKSGGEIATIFLARSTYRRRPSSGGGQCLRVIRTDLHHPGCQPPRLAPVAPHRLAMRSLLHPYHTCGGPASANFERSR